jgi:hypothetical protein
MQIRRWTSRRSPRSPAARLAVAVLPLLGLLAPTAATAKGGVEISVCSGGGERVIAIPAHKSPQRRPEDREAGCAHFVCPRERTAGDLADEEEE